MATKDDIIDFSALEKELKREVCKQRKHEAENEAKLRAVTYRGSYEQFRSIVSACDLKPLEKKDRDTLNRKQPWNPVAPGNNQP